MQIDRLHPHLSKGRAYVEFETPDEAQKALKHMDGGCSFYCFQIADSGCACVFLFTLTVIVTKTGQIDGQEITAAAVLTQRLRPPPRRLSPPRRMPPPPPMWRRSPPRMRRRYHLQTDFHCVLFAVIRFHPSKFSFLFRSRSPRRRSPARRRSRSRSPGRRRHRSRSSSNSSR